jgi:hypothetical protein
VIDLPRLELWTIEIVASLAREGVFETDSFDLKEKLPHPKSEDDKTRLRKSIAAFANYSGGFLVFGVKDQKELRAHDRLVGMPADVDLPEHFGSYPASCEPSISWRFKNPAIMLPNCRLVHVVFVPVSLQRPHAIQVRDGEFIFPKRTNKGNEAMSYEEIRSAFQFSEFRRSKLTVLIAELEHIRTLANHVKTEVVAVKTRGIQRGWLLQSAWATRYPTLLLDSVLSDVHTFIASDTDLWKDLQDIRTTAVRHNAVCEGFSHIAYINVSNRESIDAAHYGHVEEDAEKLLQLTVQASERLRAHVKAP